ncbi:hypothetical protein GW17_00060926 [Ensete ventricosum]|nr:hypothetical protein GW17_00060926 [Ensete ventricosum]
MATLVRQPHRHSRALEPPRQAQAILYAMLPTQWVILTVDDLVERDPGNRQGSSPRRIVLVEEADRDATRRQLLICTLELILGMDSQEIDSDKWTLGKSARCVVINLSATVRKRHLS